MAEENTHERSLGDLLNRYRYLGVAVALIGGGALVLVIFKDVIFRGGGESTLGLNSFIAIAAVGLLIIFAIVVDARAKNRGLTERAEKLGEMAKRLYATVEELNAANEELARARLQADFASQAKSAFLSDLSGRIKSPINAILGDALILRNKQELTDIQRKAVDGIALNSENLLAIINDVVEISRIEAGAVDFTPADFDLGELIGDLREVFASRAAERGLEFEIDVPAQGCGVVNGDARLLREILEFLFAHAVEASDGGTVHFRVSRRGENDFAFEVRDAAAGLSGEAPAHIFEPFRIREGESVKGETGLGHAIAAKKAALMGGTLTCDSTEGEGRRFSFVVKLPAAAAARAANA